MALCLQHYYATRDPLGAAGDFTTAPEISQMFGELIGLWTTQVWEGMGGRPHCGSSNSARAAAPSWPTRCAPAALVPDFCRRRIDPPRRDEPCPAGEAGNDPRRSNRNGQLARDAGRHSRRARHRHRQRVLRRPADPAVHGDRARLVRASRRHRGRCFRLRPERRSGAGTSAAGGGQARSLNVRVPASLFSTGSGAGLRPKAARLSSSTTATSVRAFATRSRRCSATPSRIRSRSRATRTLPRMSTSFSLPGAARLRACGSSARRRKASSFRALGIAIRASTLKRRASAGQAEDIDRAVERLTGRGPAAMGELFKVLGLSHPSILSLPGLHPRAARPPTRS